MIDQTSQSFGYTAQYQAVDSISREPVEGHVTFSDRMDLFPKDQLPFVGGHVGGITFDGDNHKRVFAWIGLRSPAHVTLPVYNPDCVTGELLLDPLDGGIYTVFNSGIRVIPLNRKQPQDSQR